MMFRFWSSAYVRHLEAEIEWLRLEMRKEKQRADDSVNLLLQVKTQGAASLPVRPLIASSEREVGTEVSDLLRDSEFMQVGT